MVTLAVAAAEPPYSVGENTWNVAWGNHRARVRVASPSDADVAHLPWRRRDRDAADKAILVVHGATRQRVTNAVSIAISRDCGTLIFQATTAGEYHIYFMPFTVQGGAFPTTLYNKPDSAADEAWRQRYKPNWQSLPKAELIDFQSRSEFHRRDPMELVATAAERHALLTSPKEKPFWMVEISGIPFGVMSEMLQGGGNPWRGMLYGMTSRLPWSGDPTPLWKLWDDFGIADSEMLGYWDPKCPVSTGRDDVLATVYRKKSAALVCVASWANQPIDCRLDIDWDALGLDPAQAKLYAPEVRGLQVEDLFKPGESLPIAPGKGWLLILDQAPRTLRNVQATDAYESRRVLLAEDFTGKNLGGLWKTVRSTREHGLLTLEDGGLVIKTTANTCAFVEHPLPPGTTMVECTLDAGTDKGQTWGLGLGLAWKDDRFVRIHLRAEDRRLGYDDGRQVYFGPAIGRESQKVRIRLESDQVVLEYLYGMRRGAEQWRLVGSIDRVRYVGDPASVLIGKMNHAGLNVDFPEPGSAGSCRAGELRIRGSRVGSHNHGEPERDR
jgi:hypothetical protein